MGLSSKAAISFQVVPLNGLSPLSCSKFSQVSLHLIYVCSVALSPETDLELYFSGFLQHLDYLPEKLVPRHSAWSLGVRTPACEVGLGCKTGLGLFAALTLLPLPCFRGWFCFHLQNDYSSASSTVSGPNYMCSQLLMFLFSYSRTMWQVILRVALCHGKTASAGHCAGRFWGPGGSRGPLCGVGSP